MASEANPLFSTEEISEHDEDAEKKESLNNELAVDHIYAQKFVYTKATAGQFTKNVEAYIKKMLNELGIVFFKSQIFYSAKTPSLTSTEDFDSPGNTVTHDEDLGAAIHCVIEFHLFSIECLGEDDTVKINNHVKEFLDGFNEQAVRLISTDVLARTNTQFRKPVYTPQSCTQ